MGDASNKATRQVSKPSRWQGIKANLRKFLGLKESLMKQSVVIIITLY